MYRQLYKKFKKSPTFTTWLNYGVKSINVVVILPIIVTVFDTNIVNVWLVFQVVFGLKDLLDLGMVGNFSRSYAYVSGGFDLINNDRELNETERQILTKKIYTFSKKLYLKIGFFSLLLMISLGSLGVYKTIRVAGNDIELWIAWSIVSVVSSLLLYANVYTSYLIGRNHVALVRRWDTLFSFLSSFCVIIALYWWPSILAIVLITYFWLFAAVIRNYWFAYNVENKYLKSAGIVSDTFSAKGVILKNSMKDFIGGLAGYGFLKVLDLIIANIAAPNMVASYLMSSRILDQIKLVSGAPFYSKIPFLTKAFVRDRVSFVHSVFKSSLINYIGLLLPTLILFFYSDKLLQLIDSNVKFVSRDLWFLMIVFSLIERFTSIHSNVYAIVNNKVKTHVGLIATAIISICFIGLTYGIMGIYSIPAGGIFSYLCFYSWWISYKNYKVFGLKF